MSEDLLEELGIRARSPDRRTDIKVAGSALAPPPADLDALDGAEAAIGRTLPLLLRAVYLRVGDGGFGPAYGLLPLFSPEPGDDHDSLVGRYLSLSTRQPRDPNWSWPPNLVPFCDWGGGISTCTDCSTEQGAVLTFDPDSYEDGGPMASAFAQTHPSVEAWFSDWLRGVDLGSLMFEPDPENSKTGMNPFTKRPILFTARRLRRHP